MHLNYLPCPAQNSIQWISRCALIGCNDVAFPFNWMSIALISCNSSASILKSCKEWSFKDTATTVHNSQLFDLVDFYLVFICSLTGLGLRRFAPC